MAQREAVRAMLQRAHVPHTETAIDFTVRSTSRDRGWNGLTATLYDATSGIDETLFSNHSVSMHVGRPVGITTRCDGAVSRRLQVPGDLKIVPAGYARVWEVEAPTTKLTLGIAPSLMYSVADEAGVRVQRVAITPRLHVRDARIEHIGWALKEELETTTPFGRLYADGLGLALAAHLLQRYGATAAREPAGGLPQRSLRRVRDYVDDHIAEDLTLATLARLANVSQSHFKVLFKRSTGVPVHEYVVRRRVDVALDLLVADDAPLTEIALRAGFANQSHMALWIRRVTGRTPNTLRKG